MLQRVRKFDDRSVDFASGKKISPPKNLWKRCDCCGLPIVKGWTLSNGDNVGEDCDDVIARAGTELQCKFSDSAESFEVRYKRGNGWNLKPAVKRYLQANIFDKP